jgi:hypothetical protein
LLVCNLHFGSTSQSKAVTGQYDVSNDGCASLQSISAFYSWSAPNPFQ